MWYTVIDVQQLSSFGCRELHFHRARKHWIMQREGPLTRSVLQDCCRVGDDILMGSSRWVPDALLRDIRK